MARWGEGQIIRAFKERRADVAAEEVYQTGIDNVVDRITAEADDDVAYVIYTVLNGNRAGFIGVGELLFSSWGLRRRRRVEKAIADGKILELFLEWLSNGGLELIIQLILLLIGGSVGIPVRRIA